MAAVTVQRLHELADAAASDDRAAREWTQLYARASEQVRRAYNVERAARVRPTHVRAGSVVRRSGPIVEEG